MSQQIINISNPDDGLGDKLRNGFNKTNQNFTELYNNKVDKITGKGLSENDFTDADKDKLDGIEAGAQVNVNADFGENDTDAPGYILNRPPSMYASVGYFDHNDLATQTTPINYMNYTNAYLKNDALGSFTDLSQAPYNVANIWDAVNNQFDFNDLQIGDTLDLRVDLLISTTGTNKTGKVFLKLGIGTPSEYDVLVGSNEFKTAVTDEKIICETSFYIGNEDIRTAPAKLYAYVDTTGTIKVNGWYTRILRKNLNIVNIQNNANGFGTFSNSLTTDDTIPDAGIFNYTNILGVQVKTTWDNIKAKLASIFLTKDSTVDVEKVYIKNADGTQGMKPVSDLITLDRLVYFFQGGSSMPTINTWYGNHVGFAINGTTTFGNGASPAFPFNTIGAMVIPSGYIVEKIIFGEYSNPVSVSHDLEIYIARGEFTDNQLANQLTNYDVIANETISIGYLAASPKFFKNLTISNHSAKERSAIQIAMRQKTNNSQSAYSMTIILKKT